MKACWSLFCFIKLSFSFTVTLSCSFSSQRLFTICLRRKISSSSAFCSCCYCWDVYRCEGVFEPLFNTSFFPANWEHFVGLWDSRHIEPFHYVDDDGDCQGGAISITDPFLEWGSAGLEKFSWELRLLGTALQRFSKSLMRPLIGGINGVSDPPVEGVISWNFFRVATGDTSWTNSCRLPITSI